MSADMKAATEHARKCLAAERRLEEVERKARRDLQNQAKQHAEAKAALRKEAHTQLFNQGNVIEEQTARAESAEQRAAELTAALEAERKANDLIAQERDAFETALEAERKAHKETSRQANAAIETANASWGNEREVRHTIENTLTKIQRMSETGTAQSFLKLTDQGKARWFANALIESSARKKWQERAESAEATLETAAEDAAASWDAARAAEQRAADLQARQERVEEALRSIISSEKRGETAEYLAHIATRALSAQPKVAAGQAKNNLGLGSPRTQEPAPSAAPIAHSKSQYRRMTAQGADVAPPDAAQASDWPFKVLE